MTIKPIDFHLSFNNTIYESKDKQNDFNRIKDTNAFLQNHQKNEIERSKNKIQHTEHTEGKKINKEDSQDSKNNKRRNGSKKSSKSLNSHSENNEKSRDLDKKGQKLDIFI